MVERSPNAASIETAWWQRRLKAMGIWQTSMTQLHPRKRNSHLWVTGVLGGTASRVALSISRPVFGVKRQQVALKYSRQGLYH